MVAVFLVTLYEYSPLFYISVVSLCFVVTAAMVLGWFGFDVHGILRNSDELHSVLPTPEKQMVKVTNPFSLELGSKVASVTDGAWLRTCCLEPSVLTCFWGCDVYALQAALKAHQYGSRLRTPQCFQQALNSHYYHNQSFQYPFFKLRLLRRNMSALVNWCKSSKYKSKQKESWVTDLCHLLCYIIWFTGCLVQVFLSWL